jgi:hypothetical protein
MTATGKTPAAVIVAVALYLLFGALFLLGGVLATADGEGAMPLLIAVAALVLLGVLAWRLLRGSRGAQITGVVVSLLIVVSTLRYETLRWVSVPLGIASAVLLLAPADVRAYFSDGGRTALRHSRASG